MSGGRRPTRAELELWRRLTKDVQPLIPRKADPTPKAPPPAASDSEPSPNGTPGARIQPGATVEPAATPPSSRPTSGIDRRSWQRLRRGQMTIDRRLDLHGLTEFEAHRQLDRFLDDAVALGLRCVLVVTGKGRDGKGVLRRMVPRWLQEPVHRERVVTWCPAQPQHGGDGALYVLVRRVRPIGDL